MSLKGIVNYRKRLVDRLRAKVPELSNLDVESIELDWFTVYNADGSDDKPAQVFIYDEIGGSFGVDAKQFAEALTEITAPEIEVRINSPGGGVFDGIAIRNSLLRHPARITSVVDGLAASIASVITLAGDEVIMMPGSQMMIHDALAIEVGNAQAMREMAEFLDRQSENIAGIYAKKGGGEANEWRQLMLAETWMFAEEAVEMGLADSIWEQSESDPDDEPEEEEELDIDALMKAMREVHNLDRFPYKYQSREEAMPPKASIHPGASIYPTSHLDTDRLHNILKGVLVA